MKSFSKKLKWQLNSLDLLLLSLPLIGIFGSFFSFYGIFSAIKVLLAVSVIISISAFIFRSYIDFFPKFSVPRHFYLVALLCLLVRSDLFVYLAGGQDQGVYVSLASYIERTGSFYVNIDPTLDLIPMSIEKYYLAHRPPFYGLYFSFYPMHPVMMAVSNGIFGSEYTTLPMAVFGFLTAIAFYLITYKLTSSRTLSLLMMAFIGLHPLHKFLSIFPVSEVPALFFTSFAFYYFLKFRDQLESGLPAWRFAVFSYIFWCGFFLVRMNSFLYAPLMYGALFMSIFLIEEKDRRKSMIFYFASLLGLLILSFYIYHLYLPRLYSDIVKYHLLSPLGKNPHFKVFILGMFLTFFTTVLILYRDQFKPLVLKLYYSRSLRTAIIVLVFVLLAVYLVRYLSGPIFGSGKISGQINRFSGSLNGWKAIASLNLWNTFIYLSPFGFCLYLSILWRERYSKNHIFISLLSFSAFYLITLLIIRPFASGAFYFARYQMSEIVPISLLVIVIGYFGINKDASKANKAFKFSLAALMIIYFTSYTATLFQGPEGPDPKFFESIKERVGEKDLLVFEIPRNELVYNEVVQPLEFFYNMNIVRVHDLAELKEEKFKALSENFDKIFLISNRKLESIYYVEMQELIYTQGMYHNNNGHTYLGFIEDYQKGRGPRAISIPTLYSQYKLSYFLHEVALENL